MKTLSIYGLLQHSLQSSSMYEADCFWEFNLQHHTAMGLIQHNIYVQNNNVTTNKGIEFAAIRSWDTWKTTRLPFAPNLPSLWWVVQDWQGCANCKCLSVGEADEGKGNDGYNSIRTQPWAQTLLVSFPNVDCAKWQRHLRKQRHKWQVLSVHSCNCDQENGSMSPQPKRS